MSQPESWWFDLLCALSLSPGNGFWYESKFKPGGVLAAGPGENEVCVCVCDLDKEVEKFPPILFHVGDTATDVRAEMGWERTVAREEAVS